MRQLTISPRFKSSGGISFFNESQKSYDLTVSQALSVIKTHQAEKGSPVHVASLASKLGLRLFKIGTLPDGFSGMIRKEADGRFHIYVNKSHARNRRRFTTAHEIAHFILHRDVMGDGVFDDAMYRSGLGTTQEREANALAAEILMPWHLLSQAITEYTGPHDQMLEYLADRFWVSTQSMNIRIGIKSRSSQLSNAQY